MEQTTLPAIAGSNQVLFILDNLPDWQSLASVAPAGSQVVRLDAGTDALAQMAHYLEGRQGIDAIHMVTHGAPGALHLGTTTVTNANLDVHQAQWEAIGRSLAADGDLLLYGCDVAAGVEGQAFVQALSELTGADVAASTDLTGNAAQGGNWVLESQTGAVQASADWAKYTQFSSVLADQTINLAGAITAGSLASGDFTIDGVRFVVSAPSGVTVTQTGGGLLLEETAAAGDFVLTITDTGANPQFTPSSTYIDHTSTGGHPTNGAYLSFAYGNASTTAGLSQFSGNSIDFKLGGAQIANQIVVTDLENSDPAIKTKFFIKDFVVDLAATNSPSDTTPPTVTSIVRQTPAGATTNADSLVYRVTFNEGVTGIDTADFAATGSTATVTNMASAGSNAYDVTVSGGNLAGYNGTVTLGFAAGQNILDTAGNALASTTPTGTNNNSYTLDNTPPTLAITSSASTLKAGQTATITFTFSEDPGATFTWDGSTGDVVVSGGTLGAISGSGLTRTATFTPTASTNSGTASITVASGTYTDTAGNNGGAGTTPSINFDTLAPATPPTPVLSAGSDSGASNSDRITNITTPTFTGTAEAGSTVTLYDTDGTTVLGSGAATGGNWSITSSTLANGSHGLTVKASDSAGNVSTASSGLSVTVDTTTPTLSITSSASTLKAGQTATITFTFSEDPGATFTWDGSTGDVVVSGGTLGAISGSGLTRTATFTPTASTNSGTASITVASGTYTDTAGNNGGAGTTPSINFDTLAPATPPTPVLSAGSDSGASNSDRITNITTPTFTGTAEAGSTVTLYDTDGTTVLGSGAATGGNWSITSSTLANGSHGLTVKASDSAGNVSTASSGLSVTVDTTTPTLSITSSASTLKAGQTATITFTFSEDPGATFTWDGSTGDVVVSGGTLGAISGSGLTRTATFTPTASTNSGTASITVASGTYTDTAGNNGGAGTTPSINFDTLAPATPPTPVLSAGSDSGASNSDRITNITTPTFTGTAEAGSTVTLYDTDGTTVLGSGAATGGNWSITSSALAAGVHTIKATSTDTAGNASPLSAGVDVTIDTHAPVFASATVTGNKLVMTYVEAGMLDTANPPLAGAFTVLVGATPNVATLVAVDAAAKTITLTLTTAVSSGQSITVAYADPTGGDDLQAIQNTVGNDAATLAATAVTNSTPAPDSGTPPGTPIDGVPVTTEPGPGGSTIITIPVVLPTRPDTPGTPSPLADIPLVTSPSGTPIVSVGVPTGVGLQAEGLTTTTLGSAALAELGFRIERIAGDSPELTNAGQVFYATLAPNEPLSVQILKPTIGAGYDGSQPLVITGSNNPADGKQAVILDARSLPSGTVIQVDNIEFIAVVGNVRLIGGAGQNAASGDSGAQWIVLGPDDDIIHGGGGNDVVGSEAGDDQVFGDAGDDIVFGGAGNDLLSGGTGSDRLNGGTGFDVAIQEGTRADYTVTLEGAGIKLTHTATGVSDWLVDVEQVRFATGPSLTVAHSAAEEAGAYLFQKWIGRDLNQGEGAIIQSLTGKTALEVATLFAQVFPEQSAGKTPAQLLEGMGAAGAIRVDAVRDVTVTGDAGNNTISPTLGLARYVDGGAGIDTVVIPATLSQTYVQSQNNGSFTLQRLTDGAMLDVTRVERVTFNDTKLALDLNGHAGEAAKLLGALGGPALLTNKGVVGEVIRLLDAGATGQTIAGLGLQLLGASTPTQIAQTLWTNVVGRAGTDGELKLLTDIMAGGVSASELTVMAANLEMNAVRIDLVGLTAKGIEFA